MYTERMEHWRSKTRLSSKLKPWTATNQTKLQKKPTMGTRGETETRETSTKVNTKIKVNVKLSNIITTSRHKRRPGEREKRGESMNKHSNPNAQSIQTQEKTL